MTAPEQIIQDSIEFFTGARHVVYNVLGDLTTDEKEYLFYSGKAEAYTLCINELQDARKRMRNLIYD